MNSYNKYNKNKRKLNYMILIIMILVISIGYAILSTNLNIVGSSQISAPTWDIHWENVVVKAGSVTASTPTIDTPKTTVNYSVTLTIPGEYYEFTVDAVNAGTIDGMVSVVSNKLNGTEITTLPNYLEYKVSYVDGVDIAPNQILAAGTSEKYKVHVGYKKDINVSDIPATPQTLNLSFSVTYVQSDSNAEEIEHLSLQVGDYFTLVPDSSSYTIPASSTGHDTDQTITPNELTLWRIIAKNADNSYDAVSEYISSTSVFFQGETGFVNFVGTLQTIASQYAKTGYTQATRMIGYDGQTLNTTNRNYIRGSYYETPSPTEGTGEEFFQGAGGDTLYLKDYLLVSNLYKTDPTYGSNGLTAYKVNNQTPSGNDYWISSRATYDAGMFFVAYTLRVREVFYNSYINDSTFYHADMYSYDNEEGTPYESQRYDEASVRPIITIKPNLKIDGGSGTKIDPYNLNNQ